MGLSRNASRDNIPPKPNIGAFTKLLVRLSTASWKDDEPIRRRTAGQLRIVAGSGWLVRQARARNFVIWRPFVRRGDVFGLIVLPQDVRLKTAERTAVAIDLLCSAKAVDDPLFLLEEIGGKAGFVRHFPNAGWKVQSALAPAWGTPRASFGLPAWFCRLHEG